MKMAATKTRTCSKCHKVFSYPIGRGNDRIYCGETCSYQMSLLRLQEKVKHLPICQTEGCPFRANRKNSSRCERCYIRMRRNGHTNIRRVKGRYTTSSGYIQVLDKSHPLADKKGIIYEHRKIVYDANGSSPLVCGWCDKPIASWEDVCVDHLNERKTDNRIENLLIACNTCNRVRGSMIGLLDRIKSPQARQRFIEAIMDRWALAPHRAGNCSEMPNSSHRG